MNFSISKSQVKIIFSRNLNLTVRSIGVMIMEGSLISIGRGTLQCMKKFKSLGMNLVLEVLLKLILGIVLVYFGFRSNGAVMGIMLATLFSYLFIFPPLRDVLAKKVDDGIDSKVDIIKFYKSILFISIEQIALIWIYHNNFGSILLILMANSFLLFLLNLILIIFYGKKTKNKGYETGENFSINTGL